MTRRIVTPLHVLAELRGVQTSFIDATGKQRHPSIETLREVLRAFGVDAENDQHINDSIEQVRIERRDRCLEPVILQWDDKPARVRLPSVCHKLTITPFSNGNGNERLSAATWTVTPSDGILRVPKLPHGYYRVDLEKSHSIAQTLLIAAPSKAYGGQGTLQWGGFLPMYAARSDRSWGAGSFGEWAQLTHSIANAGGSVMATLPVLAAFMGDWKSEPSPYSPVSRLFWNEFYLDITRIPEFLRCRAARQAFDSSAMQRILADFRKSPVVDYGREMAVKRHILSLLAESLLRSNSDRRQQFETYLKGRVELGRYAEFRAACDRLRKGWQTWPQRMRDGPLQPGDFTARDRHYHAYVQWLAQEQMEGLLVESRQRGVCLYLDLPLGVDPDGFDVWHERDSFALNANVGAPPDAFFTKGQNWGFPPLHPERIRNNGYRYVIDILTFQMRHTGLLRLDHVMGLHRLWWVPRGASAADGAYVRYRAEELYAILCLESHRHHTVLVGENLGTVPPVVNRKMKRHGLRTMYVVQYELQANGNRALRPPPRDCVASINTHDMPSWAAFWGGLDIEDRRQLGLLTPAEVSIEAKRRHRLRRALTRFLIKKRLLAAKADARQVLRGLLEFLGRGPAELVLVNLEDLWLEAKAQNTPGTTTERVNWRRKTRRNVPEMMKRSDVLDLLKSVQRPVKRV